MDDRELIRKLKDPETRSNAFLQLIEKYQERIYVHIRRMVIDHEDANDLVQEVFIKVYQKIESFREDSKIYTWIYRIATNACLNFLAAKKRRMFFSLESTTDQLISKLDESILIDGDEIQRKLHAAILKLPKKQQLVFNLKYFDEMKYEEIHEITGTSVGALKASYHHAVNKIEEYLKEN